MELQVTQGSRSYQDFALSPSQERCPEGTADGLLMPPTNTKFILLGSGLFKKGTAEKTFEKGLIQG